MKLSMCALVAALFCGVLGPVACVADEKPVQLSFFAPLQIYPEETDITAFRLNLIYGRNASLTGIDLGFINHLTTGESVGAQIGFFGWNDADFSGWQYNTVNITKTNFKGLQWGFVNVAGNARGLQLGFFNYSETMHGLQLGFINVIREGGLLPVFPLINWSF